MSVTRKVISTDSEPTLIGNEEDLPIREVSVKSQAFGIGLRRGNPISGRTLSATRALRKILSSINIESMRGVEPLTY
jgi:hypothetical protein